MADRNRMLMLAGAGAAAIVVVLLLANSGDREAPPSDVANPALGGGELEIYLYEDYMCGHCRDYTLSPAFEHLYDTWIATDKVRVVWKHVAFVGANSGPAAITSQCVYQLDPDVWLDFDHAVYLDQAEGGQPTPSRLSSMAVHLGIDRDALDDCTANDTSGKALLDSNLADLSASGATGTPSLVIAGTAYNPNEVDAVDVAIREALSGA